MFERIADQFIDDKPKGNGSVNISGDIVDINRNFNLGLRNVVEPEELVDQVTEVLGKVNGSDLWRLVYPLVDKCHRPYPALAVPQCFQNFLVSDIPGLEV